MSVNTTFEIPLSHKLSKEENSLKTQQNIIFISHYLAVILRVSDFSSFENIVILLPCSSDIALTQNVKKLWLGINFSKETLIFDNKI